MPEPTLTADALTQAPEEHLLERSWGYRNDWAWAVPGLSTSDRITLLFLTQASNNWGVSWYGRTRIAEATSQSDRTISRSLASLEAAKVIVRVERRRLDGGHASWVTVLGCCVPGVGDTDATPPGHTSTPPLDTESTPPSTQSRPNLSSKNRSKENHSNEPALATDVDGFAEVWDAYPTRKGRSGDKDRALRVWKKHKLSDCRTDVLIAVKRYAASRAGQDAQFTRHCSNWLADDVWRDDLPRTVDGTTRGASLSPKEIVAKLNVPADQMRAAWEALAPAEKAAVREAGGVSAIMAMDERAALNALRVALRGGVGA